MLTPCLMSDEVVTSNITFHCTLIVDIPHWWRINIISGNGLVLPGDESLSGPVLTIFKLPYGITKGQWVNTLRFEEISLVWYTVLANTFYRVTITLTCVPLGKLPDRGSDVALNRQQAISGAKIIYGLVCPFNRTHMDAIMPLSAPTSNGLERWSNTYLNKVMARF